MDDWPNLAPSPVEKLADLVRVAVEREVRRREALAERRKRR